MDEIRDNMVGMKINYNCEYVIRVAIKIQIQNHNGFRNKRFTREKS